MPLASESMAATSKFVDMDNRTLSHGEVLKFFHGLCFDAKKLAGVNKLIWQGDLKRNLLSSSSTTKQKHVPSLEELKRAKINLLDNSIRARDRVKVLNETALKFDKCFENILRKKHTVIRGIAKTRTQSLTSAFDIEASKSEEKVKYVVTNKRSRTSVLDVQMDVRANALGRSQGSVQTDCEVSGSAKTISSEEKDPILFNCIDNREKFSMKKKRSGVKTEVCPNTYLNKPLDGDQESEGVVQQRLNNDAKSRFGTAYGFRSEPSNGVFGVGKLETSQRAGRSMRSTSKNDQTDGSHPNDRRENVVLLDKEKVNVKAFNRYGQCWIHILIGIYVDNLVFFFSSV